MKEAKTPPAAAIIGDTENIFALPCVEQEYIFLKMSLNVQTALRKIRMISNLLDSTFDPEAKPWIKQKRGDAMEELSELETLLEYCNNNGYDFAKS